MADSDSNVKAQALSQSQSFGLDKKGMPTTALVQTNQYSVDLGTAASFGLGSWDLREETSTRTGDDDIKKIKEITDCQNFAIEAEKIARETIGKSQFPEDVENFMNRMAKTLTEFPSASGLTIRSVNSRESAGNTNYQRYGSSGFKKDYFEPDVVDEDGTRHPSNQVRHAVGGMLAGYNESLITARNNLRGRATNNTNDALSVMNDREDPNDQDHGAPDMRLNGQTVPMGRNLAGGQSRIYARDLGDWIRRTLCE